MGIKELAAKVAEAHPELSGNKAAQVLRTALGLIAEELGAAADGTVKMAPLGTFHISTKPGEGEGAEAKRKVLLRTAKKDADAKAAAKAARAEKGEKGAKPDAAEREAKRASRVAGKAERKATKGPNVDRAAKKAARAAKAGGDAA